MHNVNPWIVIAAMICGTVLAFGVFIWPTPFRYETLSRPSYSGHKEVVFRINRLTGRAVLVADPLPVATDSR